MDEVCVVCGGGGSVAGGPGGYLVSLDAWLRWGGQDGLLHRGGLTILQDQGLGWGLEPGRDAGTTNTQSTSEEETGAATLSTCC